MIIAYHAIFTTYGTWLPNDPRGSYSVEVYNQELRALGDIRYGRQDPQPSKAALRRFHVAAVPSLKRPAYFIDDPTRAVVAGGFAEAVERLGLTVRAGAIMNEHVHVVVERSARRIECLVGQLKGAATGALGLAKTPWARPCWKVFLNSEQALRAAVAYVEANPAAAGRARQNWAFVTPLFARDVWRSSARRPSS